MNETRYTLAQAAMATGLDVMTLAERRKDKMEWRQKGYTLDEIKTLVDGHPLKPRDQINPRAYKALELWARLNAEA